MATIHPTAVVHATAQLADDVEIGPHCVVEEDVQIGSGTVLRPCSVVRRYTTLGEGNLVDSFCSLGGWPQDFKFDADTVSYLRIGNGNTFREGVTISRATHAGGVTTVGNNTFWMANSHAGHDVTVHDNVILPNGCAIAGHAVIHSGAILSANGAVHQFVWVGEGAMFQGGAMVGQHVPPYCIVTGVNYVAGLNTVGLRRNPDISTEDRRQLKDAFNLFYRSGLAARHGLEAMEEHAEWGPIASRFREFIRNALTAERPHARGLCALHKSHHHSDG